MDDKEFWKYIVLAILSFLSGIAYVLKNFFKEITERKLEHEFKMIYGFLGSALTCWVVFELCVYFNFNQSLSLALAGGSGYLGADFLLEILQKFLNTKIDKTRKMED